MKIAGDVAAAVGMIGRRRKRERAGEVTAVPLRRPSGFSLARVSRAAKGLSPQETRVPLRTLTVMGLLTLMLAGCGGSSSSTRTGLATGTEVVYRVASSLSNTSSGPAIDQAVGIMRGRLQALGVAGGVTRRGDEIVVHLPDVNGTSRAEKLLGSTAQLEFYDWEANALTPDGKPVASQLMIQNPDAQAISQGASGQPPGNPNAGTMPLYDAVKLASKQAPEPASDNARHTPEYFMFGAPGSPACAAAAKAAGQPATVGTRCLLSGPNDTKQDVLQGLPSGVHASDGQIFTVPRGITIIQAVPKSFTQPLIFADPSAQFYVLKDHVALFGNDLTNPQQSTDQGGSPDVSFGFTSHGKNAFQKVTGDIAHRGQLNSPLGQQQNQHFAVALDNQLVTVPNIDWRQFPDGIPADQGADITGGFTTSSAQDLATQLRLGGLPVKLKLISTFSAASRTSAIADVQADLGSVIGKQLRRQKVSDKLRAVSCTHESGNNYKCEIRFSAGEVVAYSVTYPETGGTFHYRLIQGPSTGAGNGSQDQFTSEGGPPGTEADDPVFAWANEVSCRDFSEHGSAWIDQAATIFAKYDASRQPNVTLPRIEAAYRLTLRALCAKAKNKNYDPGVDAGDAVASQLGY